MKSIVSTLLSMVVVTFLAACNTTPSESHENGGHGDHGDHKKQKAEITTEAHWNIENNYAMEDTRIDIQVQDEYGEKVEEFDINHEKLFHLILVSKDLSYFSHIHPEYKENGLFQVKNEFPAGGDYKAFADYIPTNGNQQVKSEWFKIEGDFLPEQPLIVETDLTKVVDGKEVTLSFDELKSNQDVTMTFMIKDVLTKEPISNLEPYLGAVGHVVTLDYKVETYLHVHPVDEHAKGPEAKFITTFPESGIYKIWSQFQHEGKVFTVPFVIEVP